MIVGFLSKNKIIDAAIVESLEVAHMIWPNKTFVELPENVGIGWVYFEGEFLPPQGN